MNDRPVPFVRIGAWLLPGERGNVILGDLAEAYAKRLETGRAADVWYVRELLRSSWALSRHDHEARKRSAVRAPRRRGGPPMSQTIRDLVFALKSLWRRPGFALPVVLTLALGMGVSATIFSVVEAVLFRVPAFVDPDRLVMIWNRQLEDTDQSNLLSGADFADLRERSRTLDDIAVLNEVIVAPVIGTEQPSFARLGQTSANFFDVLGVEPILGRTFVEADQTPLDPDVQQSNARPPLPILLSHDFWVRELGSDPDALGRTLRTFSFDNVIVGVLPPDFTLVLPAEADVGEDLGAAIDLWGTYRTDYTAWNRDSRGLRVIARMADGAGLADVRGELSNLAAELRSEHTLHRDNHFSLGADTLLDQRASHLRPLLLLLSGAVLCVLLVACVNASGLLLTRMVGRSGELSIRTALGAGRGTLARLAFLESLALALVGGVLGLSIAVGGMELLQWLSPAGLPQADTLSVNWPVLAFALVVVPVVAVIAGLVPTLRAARRGSDRLKVRAATPSRSHRRWGELMVATQIALTVLLLVGTGLMLRSFYQLQQVPLGFSPENVLTVDMSTVGEPPDRSRETGFAEWIERRRNQERAVSQALHALPGVIEAGAVFPVPLNGVYARTCSFSLEADGEPERQGVAYFRNVWPGYFGSLQIPILFGRDFGYADDQTGLGEWGTMMQEERTDNPRVVIDSRLAARLWPGENPIGRRLTYSIYADIAHDAEVIGVVPFVPQGDIEDPMETIYIPRSYYRSQELTLTVALEADTGQKRREIAETIRAVFPDSPVGFKPLSDYVDRAVAPTRFVLTLLGVFAGTALFLASMGLYGTMALTVKSRTNEIGVQMALGAEPRRIGRQVVLRSVLLASAGVAVGLGAAVAFSKVLSAHLVEVSATDPRTFAAAALVQVVVAALAAWIPARRAAAVNPVTALRYD